MDFTEQDMVNLRRQIYLVIMSSVHYEECVHKILKLNIAEGQEKEVCTMLIDCCAMEKMFNRFFVLQAERLCRLNPVYQDNFTEGFGVQYNTVHRLETNKLRNIGKFFAHLLYTDAIPWSIWAQAGWLRNSLFKHVLAGGSLENMRKQMFFSIKEFRRPRCPGED